MALADRNVLTKKGPTCTVCTLVAAMSPEDRATFDAWINDNTITGTAIARAVSDEYNIRIQPNTMNRHRKGDCSHGVG